MSEPKRYTGKTEGSLLGSPHWEHPDGEWVKYDDYARLKEEVYNLTFVDDFIFITRSSIKRLIEEGDKGEDGRYKTHYLIEVDKERFEKVLNHMNEFWLSNKKENKDK